MGVCLVYNAFQLVGQRAEETYHPWTCRRDSGQLWCVNVHMTADELNLSSCWSHTGNKRSIAMDEVLWGNSWLKVPKTRHFAACPSRASLFFLWSSPQQPQMVCRHIQLFLVLQPTPHILEQTTSGRETTKQISYNRQSDSERLCCGLVSTRLCSGPWIVTPTVYALVFATLRSTVYCRLEKLVVDKLNQAPSWHTSVLT